MTRHAILTVALGAAVFVACPTSARAQLCRGSVRLDHDHAKGLVEAPITFSSQFSEISVNVGGGTDTSYGGGGFFLNRYKDIGLNTWGLQTEIGGQVAATPDRKLVLCPAARLSYENLNNFLDVGVNGRGLTFSGGVSVGFLAYDTPNVSVAPTLGFFYVDSSLHFSAGGQTADSSNTYGQLELGIGLLYGGSAITPAVIVPLGLDGASTAFQITYAWGFGGKRRP
jgi:hypothetical protein